MKRLSVWLLALLLIVLAVPLMASPFQSDVGDPAEFVELLELQKLAPASAVVMDVRAINVDSRLLVIERVDLKTAPAAAVILARHPATITDETLSRNGTNERASTNTVKRRVTLVLRC